MVAASRAAEARYDRLSPFYDLIAERAERKIIRTAIEILDPRPGEAVIDIGTGTGRCLAPLARAVGPAGAVHGLDLSAGMLRRARRALAGAARRARLVRGDARALPYPAACMDAAIATFTLELFDAEEIPLVLAEWHRVLRPGGRLLVAGLSKEGPPTIAVRALEWAHRRFPDILDCRPIFVWRCLEAAGFVLADASIEEVWVPVEVVLVRKTGEGRAPGAAGGAGPPGEEGDVRQGV